MSLNRFNTYGDLEDFSRTRWHLNRQIEKLTNEIKTLPDVSCIECIDFTENSLEKIALLENTLRYTAILSEFEAMSYACRLRDICITLKCELNRDAFVKFENIREIINKVYYKAKPQKIEAVLAVLCYLKLVGVDYSLKPYEDFLVEVKARKPHKPKKQVTKDL